MESLKDYLKSNNMSLDTQIINGDALRGWIYNQQDIVQSTMDDLELTEGLVNDYYRGKMAAYEEVLKVIDK